MKYEITHWMDHGGERQEYFCLDDKGNRVEIDVTMSASTTRNDEGIDYDVEIKEINIEQMTKEQWAQIKEIYKDELLS
jgi:hypothetical protein